MNETFASLRFFNYRLWFFGALVSNIGTWMQRVGQDWLILTQLTDHSAFAVSLATALQFGPSFLLAVPAGLLADRVDRRKLLIVTQTLLGILTLALGILTVTGQVKLWHVYTLAGLLGAVAAFDNPVRQTFVAEMVPADNLANAVGLNATSFNMARLVGPGFGGLLIALIGTGWLFVANAGTFIATIAALMAMRRAELRKMPTAPRGKGQIRLGLQYVRGRSDLIVLFVVVGVISAFTLNFQMTMALMSTVEFGKGPGEYGLTGSVMAVGTLAGALIATRRKRPRMRVVVLAAAAASLSVGLMAIAPTYETFVVACIPAGLSTLTLLTTANATVQMSTPPQLRGRVMSIYMMILLGATPIGSPTVGWIGEHLGPRWAIGAGALAAGLVAVGATLWILRFWHLRVRYSFTQRPHLRVLRVEDAEAVVADEARNELRVDAATQRTQTS